jgi:hypothetical protein
MHAYLPACVHTYTHTYIHAYILQDSKLRGREIVNLEYKTAQMEVEY